MGRAALALAAVAVLGACGGGPPASVGATVADGTVEVRAKACGDAGLQRIDLVDPAAPESPLWSATLAGGSALRRVPVAGVVPGYDVVDRRPERWTGTPVRVLTEGTDGQTWGGPRLRADELREGRLLVAGRQVDLATWEGEPARCPRVGLVGAATTGAATALAAAALWWVVRGATRLVRGRDVRPDRP